MRGRKVIELTRLLVEQKLIDSRSQVLEKFLREHAGVPIP